MKHNNEKLPAEELHNQITFYLNGQQIQEVLAPGISTLDWLHKQKHLHGTKCSCNEGDCGACTVVIAFRHNETIAYEAINSCLYPAAKLHGKHIITIEALGDTKNLHPIQQSLLEHHGTQCGYCTPGFVMSMFALFATFTHPNKETILSALEGNLCRCTGYQSILDAAQEIAENFIPDQLVPQWCREIEKQLLEFEESAAMVVKPKNAVGLVNRYLTPENLKVLFDYFAMEPDALFIAGGTDLMVQMNINRKEYPVLIDLTGIPELNKLYQQADCLHIGASVTYNQLYTCDFVSQGYPELHKLISQIASQQIRNFGTLCGNIANASPIGDSLPLLMVLDANLRLQSELEIRHVPIRDFFVAYRQTALHKGEIIREVILAPTPQNAYVKCIKSAKRKSVDISAVITAMRLEQDSGTITNAIFALGGVASTPIISKTFTSLMENKKLTSIDVNQVCHAVADEFAPLSDVRGSSEYRHTLIRNHLDLYLKEFLEVPR
ncbi:MAG: FAD binding domain-containing protein [Candidatus Cloacimonetes bacterium]|nr:FAD binding domain-containing protein [Candidatus Cloacimonadota bacterium]